MDYSTTFALETAGLAFAEGVVRLMERRQVSRAELARRLGCTPANVTKILRCSNNITFTSAVRIAQALGATFRPVIKGMR